MSAVLFGTDHVLTRTSWILFGVRVCSLDQSNSGDVSPGIAPVTHIDAILHTNDCVDVCLLEYQTQWRSLLLSLLLLPMQSLLSLQLTYAVVVIVLCFFLLH